MSHLLDISIHNLHGFPKDQEIFLVINLLMLLSRDANISTKQTVWFNAETSISP